MRLLHRALTRMVKRKKIFKSSSDRNTSGNIFDESSTATVTVTLRDGTQQHSTPTTLHDMHDDILSLIFSFICVPNIHHDENDLDSTKTIADMFLTIALASTTLYKSCIYHVQTTPLSFHILSNHNVFFYCRLLAWAIKARPKLGSFKTERGQRWDLERMRIRIDGIVRACDISSLHSVTLEGTDSRNLQAAFASIFAQRPVALKELTVASDSMLDPFLSSTISRSIECMTLESHNNDQTIMKAIEHMPHLRKLQIGNLTTTEGNFSIKSKSLQELICFSSCMNVEELACPMLRKLDISYNQTSFSLLALTGCCQSLESFTLRIGWIERKAGTVARRKSEELSHILQEMPKLKHLHLQGLGSGNSQHFDFSLRSSSLESINFRGSRPTFKIVECRCPMLRLIEFECTDYHEAMDMYGLLPAVNAHYGDIGEGGYVDVRVRDCDCNAMTHVPSTCIVRLHKTKR